MALLSIITRFRVSVSVPVKFSATFRLALKFSAPSADSHLIYSLTEPEKSRLLFQVPCSHRNLFFVKTYITSTNNMSTLQTLNFDNLVPGSLPLDEIEENYRRQVPGACFSLVEPGPVENPVSVACSITAMGLLDIPEDELKKEYFPEYFSGNMLLPGSRPLAHCYCGHQFGYFSGQLGDGAAMYLGEIVNKKGERWELQLKGSGPTPYSRSADGRKVLRSSIREFLCSEAMHHLGIPTTRAGSCVTSDTRIVRDIFYDGNPIMERCTIISRIAPTFLRFGSFEIFKPTDKMTGRGGPSVGRTDILHEMLEYTIKTFFPEIYDHHADNKEDLYFEFYKEVVKRTARLVAEWQCVGFCHGVLNTDNMSIAGLTIDYGPFGFMDYFDPDFVCNASDDQGRYSYTNQPSICKWNCIKFAEAIQEALPLSRSTAVLDEVYDMEYKNHYENKMRNKLGLLRKQLDEDGELFESLLKVMKESAADFSNTFRCLCDISLSNEGEENDEAVLSNLLSNCQSAEEMKMAQQSNADVRQIQLLMMMLQSNPSLLQQLGGGIGQLQRELAKLEKGKQLKKLTQDDKTQNDTELWKKWINIYRQRLKLEIEGLECEDICKANEERTKVMKQNNPRFILRNYIAQHAIEKAEAGDFTEVRRVLNLLESPFVDSEHVGTNPKPSSDIDDDAQQATATAATTTTAAHSDQDTAGFSKEIIYDAKRPTWAVDLRVT